MTTAPSRRRRRRIAATGVVAFVLNAAWERAHWPLYQSPFTVLRWLRASAGDAMFISIADLVLTCDPAHRRLGRFCGTLGGLAVLIELDAAHRNRWQYRPGMPTVATVGITPLAQLPVTGLATLGLVDLLHRTHHTHRGRALCSPPVGGGPVGRLDLGPDGQRPGRDGTWNQSHPATSRRGGC